MALTGLEQVFVGVIIGLLGLGGGIKFGGYGKVSKAECERQHKGDGAALAEIKADIKAGFAEMKSSIASDRGEHQNIHARITDCGERIARLEG